MTPQEFIELKAILCIGFMPSRQWLTIEHEEIAQITADTKKKTDEEKFQIVLYNYAKLKLRTTFDTLEEDVRKMCQRWLVNQFPQQTGKDSYEGALADVLVNEEWMVRCRITTDKKFESECLVRAFGMNEKVDRNSSDFLEKVESYKQVTFLEISRKPVTECPRSCMEWFEMSHNIIHNEYRRMYHRVIDEEVAELASQFMRVQHPRNVEIVKQRLEGETRVEIGRQHGVSGNRVPQIVEEMMVKLRSHVSRMEIINRQTELGAKLRRILGREIGEVDEEMKNDLELQKAELKEMRRKALTMSVDDLEICTRVYNILFYRQIRTLRDLVQYSEVEILKTKNFGRKSLKEVKEVLAEHGLRLGMTPEELKEIEGEE